VGWRACSITFPGYRCKPFFLAYPLLMVREASASPRAKGNKKSAVTPHSRCLGQWPTAPSVDSVKFDFKYQHPSVVYSLLHAESDIGPSLLAYSWPSDTVKIFLCDLLRILLGSNPNHGTS
jgi:hypothetical protein